MIYRVTKFIGGIFEKNGQWCRSANFIHPEYPDGHNVSYGVIYFDTLEEMLSIELGYEFKR